VFTSTRDKTAGLYWQPADGTGAAEKIVSENSGIDQATVTPDGKYVVARSDDNIVIADFNAKGALDH
jgi:Tol biopolymer transport system component